MHIARIGAGTAIMLVWGLSATLATLRLCRVADEQHLLAGAFLSAAYGLLATPFLHWFMT
jgi:hypothetical protein